MYEDFDAMTMSGPGQQPIKVDFSLGDGVATVSLRVAVDCEALWREQETSLGRLSIDDSAAEISRAVRQRLVPAISELALQADQQVGALLLQAMTDVLRESLASKTGDNPPTLSSD